MEFILTFMGIEMTKVTITGYITYVTNGGRSQRRKRLKKVMEMTPPQATEYRRELIEKELAIEREKDRHSDITVEVYFAYGDESGTILK